MVTVTPVSGRLARTSPDSVNALPCTKRQPSSSIGCAASSTNDIDGGGVGAASGSSSSRPGA